MNTTLLVQLSGQTWEQIDLFEDIPITLTIQQNDLTNLTARRVPYSRTIIIPDTSRNAQVFEHYYEVNAEVFNPLQILPIVVQYRGTNIFEGVMRMNSVTTSGLERIYELFILGEVSDFTSRFRNLELQDLNYTDLVHDLTYDNIVESWECENDGVSGLFGGKIIYPMINYGLSYSGETTGATPSFQMSFGEDYSFDQTQYPMSPNDFKPAIQVKTLLDRMFNETQYEVVSEFFDSPYFTSMYLDTFQNSEVGVTFASAVTNQNIFQVYQEPSNEVYRKDRIHPIYWSKQIGNAFDPLNNFIFGDFGPYFRTPYAGLYGFNVRFNIQQKDITFTNGRVQVIMFKTTTPIPYQWNDISDIPVGDILYQSPDIQLFPTISNPLPVNLFINVNLAPGDLVYVRLYDRTVRIDIGFASNKGVYRISQFSDGVANDLYGPRWDLYQSPTLVGGEIDMTIGIPNINCLEFFKGLVTMFNLVVYQDENERQIRIEPYNWYFNDTDRKVRDWTKILDTNNDVKIEPLSFDLSKDIVWTYTDTDEEYLPLTFSSRFDYIFGRERFTSVSNLLQGEQVYEVPFGSCPTSGVTGAENFIIPQYYRFVSQQQEPYATKTHIFFWCGNRYAYKDALRSVQGQWYFLSGGTTPIAWNTYPCVSHLSTLESQFAPIISDLNFRSTFDFFGNNTNQIQQFTEFTLYNSFWRTYVDNLYNPYNKRLTGQFFFRPLDVYETELNDKIWIKDSWFTIEKITDADLVNKRNTQISLIKESVPYYRIEPPAPIYAITPNQPYPYPQPFYSIVCFVSTDQDLVCAGTTPNLTAVYTFGPSTLNNLDKVYIDTGTSFQLIPMGTFIRAQTDTITYVVADTYGRILEIPC
jgi:hypothetical protein